MKRRTLLKILGGTAGVAAGTSLAGSGTSARADVGLRRTSRLSREPTEEIPSLCDLCFWRCGIRAKVRDGRIVRIQGNPDHPRSRGRLCARGIAGKYQVEDEDRLKYPLRRVGERGEGKWERISWDEAIDLWASKVGEAVEKHGPGSIGVFSHGLSSRFINSFMHHLGDPNRTVPSFGQCRGPRDVGFELTFGEGPGSPARHDMARSEMIVLFGCHIGENVQTGQVAEFADAIDRGARVIVVDPRMSVSASKADRWLQIRPGTDTALLLAWINILLREKLYDEEYIRRHSSGLQELTHQMGRYTPEWAAEVTQIPREAIVSEAHQMAQRKPAVMIHCGRFTAWYGNDTQRSRAMAILTALLGAWGRPGGYYCRSSVPLGPLPCPKPETGMVASVATGRHPFTHFGVAAQELIQASVGQGSPIKQWLLYAVNPLQSIPGQGRILEAMRSLDFITMVDIIPTEGALWSDLILPEASYLERHDDILAVFDHPRPFVALRQPVVPPRFESREPYWIVQQLAHKLGHTDCFTHECVTDYLDDRLAPCGTTYEDLARKGIRQLPEQQPFFDVDDPICFETPSGKIELYSSALAEVGEDPVPRFEPVEQPPLGWFRLVAGRTPYHSFARTQNIPRLMEKDSENALWINSGVAAAKGLSNGDEVYLQNRDGYRTGPISVLTTRTIRTDVVYTVHGYGSRSHALRGAHARGVSDNALTSRFEPDRPTGCTGIRVNFVQLVTEDGREIPGVTDDCRADRAPFPELPELPAETSSAPEGDVSQKPEKRVPEPAPHPSVDPDGFFKVKLEDGC